MDYKVLARDFQLTPAIEEYLEKRMAKPDRLLRVHGDLISVPDVKVEKEGGIYKVEITAHFKKINKIIKVEQRGGDLYEIIDNVTDSFERKINKMKTKLQEHFSDTVEYDIPPRKDAFVQDKSMDIIKRQKRYDLSIMTVDEAVLQIDMLGHQFFVFKNAETDEVNAVYRRNDNSLGLIQFND